jgi:cytochrome c oxidase subunit I+III
MTEPRRTRTVLDLSELPDIAVGPSDILWWGTLGFVVIEGFTLVLCAVVYIYLTQNFNAWPPQGTPRPSLRIPTLNLALMLLSLPVVGWTARRARDFDLSSVRRGLVAATLFNAAFVGLRCWELLRSLNVRWDTNAYGSAQWLVLCMHGTLLLVELVEIGGMALLFYVAPIEQKHFSGVVEMAFYYAFMVLVWVPLYLLCFWLPRWL